MVGDFPSFEYLVRYTHTRRATVQSNELYRQAALLGPGCYTLYTEPRNLQVRTNTFKARTSMRRDDQQGTHDLRSWTSNVRVLLLSNVSVLDIVRVHELRDDENLGDKESWCHTQTVQQRLTLHYDT
ncbi:hypothetical protein J6590_103467 [Homalodisca vitripennis]|nr:hypothetical protein J6590_103467 [Homalodisca vitripennis]